MDLSIRTDLTASSAMFGLGFLTLVLVVRNLPMKIIKDSLCPYLTANRLPTLLFFLDLEVNLVRKMFVMWSDDKIDASGKELYQFTATP